METTIKPICITDTCMNEAVRVYVVPHIPWSRRRDMREACSQWKRLLPLPMIYLSVDAHYPDSPSLQRWAAFHNSMGVMMDSTTRIQVRRSGIRRSTAQSMIDIRLSMHTRFRWNSVTPTEACYALLRWMNLQNTRMEDVAPLPIAYKTVRRKYDKHMRNSFDMLLAKNGGAALTEFSFMENVPKDADEPHVINASMMKRLFRGLNDARCLKAICLGIAAEESRYRETFTRILTRVAHIPSLRRVSLRLSTYATPTCVDSMNNIANLFDHWHPDGMVAELAHWIGKQAVQVTEFSFFDAIYSRLSGSRTTDFLRELRKTTEPSRTLRINICTEHCFFGDDLLDTELILRDMPGLHLGIYPNKMSDYVDGKHLSGSRDRLQWEVMLPHDFIIQFLVAPVKD